MNCAELYAVLSEKIPASLSCSWDNDGLMCCSDPERAVRRVLVDCDADTLLVEVDSPGPACHTGHRSCFYRKVDGENLTEIAPVIIDPEKMY